MLFRLTMLLMVVATFQLSFLGIYLFWEGLKKRSGHFYLGLFFFLLALNLMDLLLKIQGYQSFYTSFAFLDDAFILAFGPLIYFYTNSIIIPDVLWKPGWWWHLLPFIVVSIFLTVALNTQSTSEQLELLQNIEDYQIPNGVKVAVIAAQLHPLIYSILSFRLLGQYRASIRQQYSNTERADLNWLGFILKFISILFIVALIHGIVPAIFGTAYLGFTLLVFAIFLLYFIIRILLRSMRNSEVLQLSVHKKYQGSNLIEGQRILLKKQLEQLIGSQKPFLDPDLTLDQLSAAMNVHSKILSQVINQSYNLTFFEWINHYRIKEAENKLISDPEATVLEILYQCGYNSKSSFNTFFKKYTGTTPTAFRVSNKT